MASKLKNLPEMLGVISSVLAGIVAVSVASSGSFGLSVAVLGAFAVIVSGIAAAYTLGARVHPERPRQVFIIYARSDLKLAKTIAERLTKEGFEPWLDVEQIQAGQRWREAIDDALTQSSSAVAILTKEFAKGSSASSELRRALEIIRPNRKDATPIIPIVLGEAEIPKSLRDVQHVSSIDDDGLKRLIQGLRYVTGVSNSTREKPLQQAD